MTPVLCLLLFSQLSSFEFTAVPSPQTAGDSFSISVIARDPSGGVHPYNGSALLSTSRDGLWSFVYPNLITFQNGVWQYPVTVTLAEDLFLRCVEPQNLVTGESNGFEVLSGPPDHLLAFLPGETPAPGTPTGRTPTPPLPQAAGREFELSVLLTDRWHNVVEARSDSVFFASSDRFARIPPGRLADGQGSFPATLRAAGVQRVSASPDPGSPVRPDTSSPVNVAAGSYDRLLVLLPGESHLPGDTASQPFLTPGKEDPPEPQFLGRPFPVTVFGADSCWNRVSAPAESVALASYSSFASEPPEAALGAGAVFQVTFHTPGPNQALWATATSGRASYLSWLDVRARATRLLVDAPDTVRAGETAYVRVTLSDEGDRPVVAAPCRFSVVRGSGEMLDSALLSDTLGRVTARFLCVRARGNEHDTIKIHADTTVYAGIFVQLPDESLLEDGVVVFPNPFGFNQDRAEITYFLRNAAPMSVTIYDTFGHEVRSWKFDTNREGALAGVNRIYWDGRNEHGRRVANGIYVVQVIGQRHTGTTFKGSQRIGVVW